jgi:hypothetical protein
VVEDERQRKVENETGPAYECVQIVYTSVLVIRIN